MNSLVHRLAPLSISGTNTLTEASDFGAFYGEHVDYVFRVLRRLGVRPADVPDVVQEAFVIAWRKRSELDPGRSVRAWLFGVAFRLAAAERRRAWFRLGRPITEADSLDPRLTPAQAAEVASELRLLDAALSELPLKWRALLMLHDLDEQPMSDVALALGIPEKTGFSRLHAARRAFRQAIRRRQLTELHITPTFPTSKGGPS
jgi:RNA polymerase sigma-70 factor, ECF subfamily